MKIKLIFLTICFNLLYSLSYEQPNSNEVFNKLMIIDSLNMKPVAFSTVAIYNDLNKNIDTTGITDTSGVFVFFPKKSDNYFARISSIGYEDKEVQIELATMSLPSKVIKIFVMPNFDSLQSVKVLSRRTRLIEAIEGGYKFNADQVAGATGSVIELLKRVPGVTLDGSENISLLGRSPTVMVNGRKVNLSGSDLTVYLKSLSASEVKSVEINNNPDARYDAGGNGGILNIMLKKNKESGLYGNISSDISTLLSTNQSANINYKRGKFNLTGSFNYTYRHDIYTRKNNFQNKALPDSLYLFNQNMKSDQNQKGHSFKVGASYDLDSNSSIVFSFFNAYFWSHTPWVTSSEIFNRMDDFQSRYIENEINEVNNNFFIYDVLYNKTFKNNSKLSIGFNYSKYNNLETDTSFRIFYNRDNVLIENQFNQQAKMVTAKPYNVTSTNIDYSSVIFKSMKLDLGGKFNTFSTESDFDSFIYDSIQNSYVLDPLLSNYLHYNENVAAGYAILSGHLNVLNFRTGIRYEHTNYKLSSKSSDSSFNRSYFNLFPNFNLSYNSKDKKTNYSLNLTKQIQRVPYSWLNPFLNTKTLGQYTVGNPNLKPYTTYKMEFQYSKSYGSGNFFMASLYYSISNDMFNGTFNYDSSANMNVQSYANLGNSLTYGGYLVLQNNITKWFNFNAYLAGTLPTFASKNKEDILLPNLFYMTGNLSLNFTLPEKTQIQLYGYCVTKNNNFQLQNLTNGNLSIAVQHKFIKDRLTASINLEDIFNINNFPTRFNNQNVFLTSDNKLRTRYFKIGLSYNFGKVFESHSNKDIKKDQRVD